MTCAKLKNVSNGGSVWAEKGMWSKESCARCHYSIKFYETCSGETGSTHVRSYNISYSFKTIIKQCKTAYRKHSLLHQVLHLCVLTMH